MDHPEFGKAPYSCPGMGVDCMGKQAAFALANEVRTRWLSIGWKINVRVDRTPQGWVVRSGLINGMPGLKDKQIVPQAKDPKIKFGDGRTGIE